MFKRDFLKKKNQIFHPELSSTADRYFLIQSHLRGKGICENNLSALLYRVSDKSMSNKLTRKLVDDNVCFYEVLQQNQLIPQEIKKEALLRGYYSIAASYFKLHCFVLAIKYSLLAIFKDPLHFMRKTLKFNT